MLHAGGSTDLGSRLLDSLIPAFRQADSLNRLIDLLNTESSSRPLQVVLIVIRTTFEVNQSIDLVDPSSKPEGKTAVELACASAIVECWKFTFPVQSYCERRMIRP